MRPEALQIGAMRRSRVAARTRSRAGFTLIELIVSLVAGLIVAMAVMGVSKEATNTFHEEVRVASAEMGLRIAMERIRLDLQRAAFMSTGNLVGDPLIAQMANNLGPNPNLGNFNGAVVPYSLQHLAGISLYPGGASVMTDANEKGQITAAPNNLTPDSIDIGGNLSSSDEYAAAVVWNPPGAAPCNTNAAISLEMTTPAGWRIRNAESQGGNNGAALQAIFHPGVNPNSQFLIRLTDQSGRYQYLVGCQGLAGVATNYNTMGAVPTAMVFLSPASTILSTNQTGGLGGVSGFAAGWVTVSPVEVARWDIQTPQQLAAISAATTGQYVYGVTALPQIADPSNFLLTRSYIDFSNQCTNGTKCPIDPFTTEIVSEYAVDMRFGFTVDQSAPVTCKVPPCATVAPTYLTNPLVNVSMTQAASTLNAFSNQTSGIFTAGVGPQRIRDVQVRLGIRSPFADRPSALVLPPSSALDTTYLYRYQLDNTSLHYNTAMPFARVRESTTEVNLPNQARFYW